MSAYSAGRSRELPLSLIILSFSVFAIGTSEFAIMGLLPTVASNLSISLPEAGRLISAYALSVAIGGPVMALATARLARKHALLLLMALFVVGNMLCVFAQSYGMLLLARVVTAFGQGAFFGVGAVVVSGLVPEHRRASAIAIMFAGLTLANVLGVPAGTALGLWEGWRTPFIVIAILGLLSLVVLQATIAVRPDERRTPIAAEVRALGDARIWVALLTTISFTMSIFVLFAFLAPFLEDVTHVSPTGVTLSLLSVGVSLAIGSYVGGWLADWNLARALTGIAVAIGVVSLLLRWTGGSFLWSETNWFVWGIVTFAAIPASQVNVMRFGDDAPNLVSTLNITAFNIGIAIGSWLAATMLANRYGLTDLPVAAAALAALAVAMTMFSRRLNSKTASFASSVVAVQPMTNG